MMGAQGREDGGEVRVGLLTLALGAALTDALLLRVGAASPLSALLGALAMLGALLPLPRRWQIAPPLLLWLQHAALLLLDRPPLPAAAASSLALLALALAACVLAGATDRLRRRLDDARAQIRREIQAREEVVRGVLPGRVAEEWLQYGAAQARRSPDATILMAGFVGFHEIARTTHPRELVYWLDWLFSSFDHVIEQHGMEKIKTVGDTYMCAGSLPDPRYDHWLQSILAALELVSLIDDWRARQPRGAPAWQLRIGIHRGPVVAGVIGRRRIAYDVWGEAVDLAARLEQEAAPGGVAVTTERYTPVEPLFEARPLPGADPARPAVLLTRIRPAYARDAQGRQPNADFWRRAERLGLLRPLPSSTTVEEEPPDLAADQIAEFTDTASGVRPTEEAPWEEASWPGKRPRPGDSASCPESLKAPPDQGAT